jgi:hypothetical protein
MGNNIALSARQLRTNKESLRCWLHGRQVPRLENLVHLCFYLGVTPLCLLRENRSTIIFNQPQAPCGIAPTPPSKKQNRNFDIKGVRRALEIVLQQAEDPPPSMREVGRRLGYAPNHLYKYFLDLCMAISARYRANLGTQHAERVQKVCEEVRQAVHILHMQGRYPSNWQVGKLLRKPSFQGERGEECLAR